jgi:hypothetical protein
LAGSFLLVLSLLFFLGNPVLAEEGGNGTYNSSLHCALCHQTIYDQWSHSLHAQAISDPVFSGAYLLAQEYKGEEAKRFCLKCHAPTTRVTRDYDLGQEVTREGVTCTFCHTVARVEGDRPPRFVLRPGDLLYGPSEGKTAPHPLQQNDVLTQSAFCGGCHDLSSPVGGPVMETYTEWKEGPYAGKKACQDCHMEAMEGVRNHKFTGGHFDSRVEQAADVALEIEREGGLAVVRVNVTNSGSGHKIPTGIPSRVLHLHLSVKDEQGNVVFHEEVAYKKVMLDENGLEIAEDYRLFLDAARVLSDNRIAPLETRTETFRFRIPENVKDLSAEATLEYHYEPVILLPTDIRIVMADASAISRVLPQEGESQLEVSPQTVLLWSGLLVLALILIFVILLRRLRER